MVSAVYRGDEAKPSVQTCTCVHRTCNRYGVTGDRYGVGQSHPRCDPCYTLLTESFYRIRTTFPPSQHHRRQREEETGSILHRYRHRTDWQYIPEFDEPTSTYADFKNAIMEFYPEAAEFLYAITDIDSLTDERQRLGMTTVQDLSEYHLQFMAITTWLIKKGQLCELGQKRAYIRAFPVQLLPTIVTRLQVNFPKHHPGIR